MRLVRYVTDAQPARVGVLTESGVRPTDQTDMLAVLAGQTPIASAAPIPLEQLRLLAPIARPGKIFGSGINYTSHKSENPDAVMPVEPGFFAKLPSSVCGPGDPIRLPQPESTVDYEVELAIVIGRAGRDIGRERALEHVFGYTVINDVSDRGVQFRAHQMDLGKGFDSFCPMGPAILTADQLGPAEQVVVRSRVNGQLRQESPISAMIYGLDELIEHASRNITLEPGDLITTGTPAGCGTFRRPPLWLRPGDVVEVSVSGIGALSNPVVAGWAGGD